MGGVATKPTKSIVGRNDKLIDVRTDNKYDEKSKSSSSNKDRSKYHGVN